MQKEKSRASLRFGIQSRVIALTLAFSVGVATIVSIGSIISVFFNTRKATLQSIEYNMQVSANSLGQSVQEIDNLADWCTVNSTVRNYTFKTSTAKDLVRNIYNTVANKYSSLHTARYIQRLLITDGAYQVMQLGTSTSLSRALTPEAIAQLPGLVSGQGDTAWQQVAKDPLLTFGTVDGIPVTRTLTNGKATARVYISVSIALITDCLRGITPDSDGELYWMMDNIMYQVEGNALLPLGTPEELGYVPASAQDGADMLDEKTLVLVKGKTPQKTVLVAYPVGDHALYVAQTLPAGALLRGLPPMQGPLVLSVLLILLLGIVLAMLLRRTIALPIRALQRQIFLISDGNFTTDPTIEWDNELGDVGRGINRLSRSVTALMEKRLEDEKQKQDLEYRMLQNQVNPHFLYNTLNSIKWMATIQHAPGIAEMTTALSRLMKSVSKGNERLVPLTDEFALVNDYFTIQQYRYGGTITMDVTYIEDESLCRRCCIPRFTLQPLVENAIFHGIEPKGCAGSIAITVRRDAANGDLLIALTDDGVGMTPEQIAKALSEPSAEEAAAKFRHVGLWNVHRRLQYSFGAAYGLSLAATPGSGTTVTIRLPGPPEAETTNK